MKGSSRSLTDRTSCKGSSRPSKDPAVKGSSHGGKQIKPYLKESYKYRYEGSTHIHRYRFRMCRLLKPIEPATAPGESDLVYFASVQSLGQTVRPKHHVALGQVLSFLATTIMPGTAAATTHNKIATGATKILTKTSWKGRFKSKKAHDRGTTKRNISRMAIGRLMVLNEIGGVLASKNFICKLC